MKRLSDQRLTELVEIVIFIDGRSETAGILKFVTELCLNLFLGPNPSELLKSNSVLPIYCAFPSIK
jgi:hypothetical protein